VTPVIKPVLETVATAAAEEDQVTARPASGLPEASFGVATRSRVAWVRTVAVSRDREIDATGTLPGGGGGGREVPGSVPPPPHPATTTRMPRASLREVPMTGIHWGTYGHALRPEKS